MRGRRHRLLVRLCGRDWLLLRVGLLLLMNGSRLLRLLRIDLARSRLYLLRDSLDRNHLLRLRRAVTVGDLDQLLL